MIRPRVLHVARDWVRPSERFVLDVVRTTSATVPSLAYGRGWPGVALPPRATCLATMPGADRGLRAGLAAVAVARRTQLLHAHFGYWAGHTEAVARRLHRPWAVSLHGHDLLVEGTPAAARADLVVVPSRFLADAASRAGVADGRLRVVPAGLDLSDLPFRVRRARDDGSVVVTFAGRFVAKKGVLQAARALAAARAEVPGLVARFVGYGPDELPLRALLAELGLPAEVIDGRPAGAVRAALASTDLLLTASVRGPDGDAETLGLVNLEAQACGVPVVTYASGGVPEALSARGATLVAEGDVTGLAAALVALAREPARWEAMGRAGREHVLLRHELGARVADLEELWAALVAHGPLPEVRPPRDRLPTVSVVVVTAGRRRLVGRALDALAAQSYPAELTEVVVVDNASTDGTAADLAARRVTVLTAPAHAPVAAARNRGVAATSGEIVAFTDDDCRPDRDWLAGLASGHRSTISIVQGATTADPEQPLRALSRTQWTPAESGLYETSNIAYTRAALTAAGGFDEEFAGEVARVLGPRFGRYPFGEDTELAWRVRRDGGASRFAATARVRHEVFAPDPGYLLRRAVVGAAWPLLLRRVPELSGLLIGGCVLGRHRLRVLVALAGLGCAAVDARAALATLPWVWGVLRPLQPGRLDRLGALPVLAARDLVATGALLYGSARARRLVL